MGKNTLKPLHNLRNKTYRSMGVQTNYITVHIAEFFIYWEKCKNNFLRVYQLV